MKKIFVNDRGFISFVNPAAQNHILLFAGLYVEWKRLCEPLNIVFVYLKL
jgi:hypothetical protein